MPLNPKFKKFLIISEKHIIAAILASSAIAHQWHFIFNWDNRAGVISVLKLLGDVIGGAMIATWLPSLTKYVNTDADPTSLDDKLDTAESNAQNTLDAVKDAKTEADKTPR